MTALEVIEKLQSLISEHQLGNPIVQLYVDYDVLLINNVVYNEQDDMLMIVDSTFDEE